MLTKIFNVIMTYMSVLTAFGVFLHDGRVDKAASTAMKSGVVTFSNTGAALQRYRAFVDTDAHTHPDHNAARSALLNSFAYQSPSVPPKGNDQKRHGHDELRARGHHAFDNASLPVIA
jgi:hypothetical protein